MLICYFTSILAGTGSAVDQEKLIHKHERDALVPYCRRDTVKLDRRQPCKKTRPSHGGSMQGLLLQISLRQADGTVPHPLALNFPGKMGERMRNTGNWLMRTGARLPAVVYRPADWNEGG